MPRLSKASAALNPPMPAPMTRTCFDVLMAIFAPREFPPRLIQRRAVIAGHSASEDARRRAYDPATHLLRNKLISKQMEPRGNRGPRPAGGEMPGAALIAPLPRMLSPPRSSAESPPRQRRRNPAPSQF